MDDQLIRILLVEDDEDDYVVTRELLSEVKGWRFDLDWAPSYEAAVKKAKEGDHQVYFIDYRLGERNGLELLREFLDAGCEVPMILLTGLRDREIDLQAMLTGAADYLEKDKLSPDLLERSIRYAIEHHKTLQALRESEARFRGIFSSAAIGIALVDLSGRILENNPALSKMLGYSNEELHGRDLRRFSHPGDRKRITKFFQGLKEEGRPSGQMECLLIRKKGPRIWGRLTFSMFHETEEFPALSICMVEDITERRRALEALVESEKKLRVLSSKLLEAQEKERKLIAQNLHDSIGASLAAMKYILEKRLDDLSKTPTSEGASIKRAISIVQDTINETKRISTNLRPSMLDDLGILATIQWSCRKFEEIYSNIQAVKDFQIEEDEVPEPLKIVIYRLLQEALNNVAKHSQADLVRVSLKKKKGRLEMSVKDNGHGFDMNEVLSREASASAMGLSGMQERTELSGGAFELSSCKGVGTILRASWPIKA